MNPFKIIPAILIIGSLSGSVYARNSVAPLMPIASSMATPDDGIAHSHSFLTREQRPDSFTLLPRPPARNSAAFRSDVAAYKAGRKLKGTARWNMATMDAIATPQNLGRVFSAAAGVTLDPKNTPITLDLISKVIRDAGKATNPAKKHYMRTRPFVTFHAHTCYPQVDQKISRNGSYPSGHASAGWAVALVLTELFPERQNEILKRGYEYGQSRMICGAHWQSDVDAGRLVGAAVFARLQADPAFLKELDAARHELNSKKSMY